MGQYSNYSPAAAAALERADEAYRQGDTDSAGTEIARAIHHGTPEDRRLIAAQLDKNGRP